MMGGIDSLGNILSLMNITIHSLNQNYWFYLFFFPAYCKLGMGGTCEYKPNSKTHEQVNDNIIFIETFNGSCILVFLKFEHKTLCLQMILRFPLKKYSIRTLFTESQKCYPMDGFLSTDLTLPNNFRIYHRTSF